MVAFKAAGDYVFPGFCPSLDDGDNVVKGEVVGGTLSPAVLARMMIAGINIGAAELYMLDMLSDLYIFEKSEDTGHLDGEADASDLPIIFSQHFNFALIKQAKRPFPGDNVNRLVGCI